jgi:hypothetical protein
LSLLTRYLDSALEAELCERVTPGGVRLADVIRSGLCHPDSAVGIYAPDSQSYAVFRELFDPVLQNFQAPARPQLQDLACLNPAAVVSTRIRVARNLAGHAFTGGMSRPERLGVEAKIVRACGALALLFPGWIKEISDIPSGRLDALVLRRLAFGPQDKFMAAAHIFADWPIGRSVFNTRRKQLTVWINEEDHLRVSVVMPGACVYACAGVMALVMSSLAEHLDFCVDAHRPFPVAPQMWAPRCGRLHGGHGLNTASEPHLASWNRGRYQIRGAAGNTLPAAADWSMSFPNRVGISAEYMLQDMEMLVTTGARFGAITVDDTHISTDSTAGIDAPEETTIWPTVQGESERPGVFKTPMATQSAPLMASQTAPPRSP